MADPQSRRARSKRSEPPTGRWDGGAGRLPTAEWHRGGERSPNRLAILGPVLAATDASAEARAALLVAADLCRMTESRLEVVYVWREPQQAEYYAETIPAPVHRAFEREARGVLAQEIAYLRSSGASVSGFHLRYGDPAPEILGLAAELEAGTIIIGSRPHGGVRRLLLGSVVEEIAARSPRPVLVRGTDRSAWPPGSVAAVVDSTQVAFSVWRTAVGLASQLDLKLRLLVPYGRGNSPLEWMTRFLKRYQCLDQVCVEVEPCTGDSMKRLRELAAQGSLIVSCAPSGGVRDRLMPTSRSVRLLKMSVASVLIVPYS